LGLTNKRIIVFKRSAFSGKPKSILGSIPISQVKDVGFEPGTLGDKITLNLGVDKGQGFTNELKSFLNLIDQHQY